MRYLLLLLLCSQCYAAPYEILVRQKDALDENYVTVVLPPPSSGTGVLAFDGNTLVNIDLPSGMSISAGALVADGMMELPSGTPDQYVNGEGDVVARLYTYVTKGLNTCYQLSTTRDALVLYAVEIVATASVIGGQRGTVYLETFTDSGCTTGTQEITRQTFGNTNALALALGNVATGTVSLSGPVPAGRYVKLRTQNNTGTPTYTASPGWEILQ